MSHCLFLLLVTIAVTLPLWFLCTIWRDRRTKGWGGISKDSRIMYVDAAKAVASASAIAASLVSTVISTAANRPIAILFSVKFAVVSLILSIVCSVVVIVALSRGYERARSRFAERQSPNTKDFEQGELNGAELLSILVPIYFGLVVFLGGF